MAEGAEGSASGFVSMQYHQAQSTLPRLKTLSQSPGVSVAKRGGRSSNDSIMALLWLPPSPVGFTGNP
jgi:hypothetical protein